MVESTAGPRRHRHTVHDYYRMGEIGILGPDTHVELIDGEIIYKLRSSKYWPGC